MPIPQTQMNASLAIVTPLGDDKLILRAFSGEESLCGLFLFEAEAEGEPTLNINAIVGAPVSVTLSGGDGLKRHANAICTRAMQVGGIYRLELRPWLWRLSLSFGSHIFQNKSVPEIIKSIFSEAGEVDFRDKLTASYPPLEYCVQYQETTLDFVCRLMEDVGIIWWFVHTQDKHELVLSDDDSAYAEAPGDGPIPLRATPDSQSWIEDRRIERLTLATRLASDAYTTRDFNFETPGTSLEASSQSTSSTFQVYEYPGRFARKTDGAALADRRLDSLRASIVVATGESPFRGLAPGTTFTLSAHPRAAANGKYRVHSVTHDATAGAYANSFICRPAQEPFRPKRVTPRPRIAGTQTAIVTGKAGEDIFTDKWGRVKVRFHWDREASDDDKSSCWLRVAHPMAGAGWGHFALPRIGQEVVVSFLDGDPDRPLVTGAVYNGANALPYALPENQTRTVWKSNSSKGGEGFNELRFEDKKDEEEVYLHAQKNLNVEVLDSATTTIDKARSVTLKEGDDALKINKGSRAVTIDEGDLATTLSKGGETHDVKGKRMLTVGGDETHSNKAALSYQVAGSFTLKVDGDVTIEAGGKITLKSGAALSLSGASAELTGSTSATLDGGGQLTVKGSVVQIN